MGYLRNAMYMNRYNICTDMFARVLHTMQTARMTSWRSGDPQRPPRPIQPRIGGEPTRPAAIFGGEPSRYRITTFPRRFYVVGPPTPSGADTPVLLRDVPTFTCAFVHTHNQLAGTKQETMP